MSFLKEREHHATEQRNNIEIRWRVMQISLESIDEIFITKQYEEVMIKNQMLNVCFDDLCAEKNKRKNLYESLLEELKMLLD